jgi:hypothetical protein
MREPGLRSHALGLARLARFSAKECDHPLRCWGFADLAQGVCGIKDEPRPTRAIVHACMASREASTTRRYSCLTFLAPGARTTGMNVASSEACPYQTNR